ncbi:MAG: SDR family NAD(P)-dependent oxidoreductase [Spirochaetaceae bacterium]
MSNRLQGKAVLVVGGTSGIGLSAAVALAREGARVAVTGRNAEKLDRARAQLPAEALVLQNDAREPASAARTVSTVRDAFGRLDALYHVAGGSGRSFGDGPLHEISDDAWRESLRLNLDSVFYSNRAALRLFLEQGGGVILNMTSVLGYSPSPRFFATHAYAAAKAAIIGMTKASAAYYADRNIRVNALAPGLVETPMAARAAADEEIMKFVRTKQPADGGRIALPQDYDGAAIFLISDEAAFMTGQVITIDGGWTVSEGQYPVQEETEA